jgi:hypothetical protein
VPDDRELLGRLVTRVCYTNALEYFGFEGPVVPERGSD